MAILNIGWKSAPMPSSPAPSALRAVDETPSAVVAARNITRVYGEGETAVHALRGVDLDVESAKLTAVMGPSGSGKSTLMHLLAGLDRPDGGTVSIAGVDVTGLDDGGLTEMRREHIGFIFQFFNLLPMLTARENILLPAEIAGDEGDEAWLADVIERVGLSDRLTHRP